MFFFFLDAITIGPNEPLVLDSSVSRPLVVNIVHVYT